MRKLSIQNWMAAALLAAGTAAMALGPVPVKADGSSDPCSGLSGQDRRDCQNGQNRSDREIYNAGYWLAQKGKYAEALKTLRQAKNQDHPAILNYIGFSMRKLGKVDDALKYYRRAITIAPDYTLARAYMGEAYLQKGDAVSAKAQLSEIGRRCGTNCEEYARLATEIRKYEAVRRS